MVCLSLCHNVVLSLSIRIDESGQTGLHYIAQVVIYLLDPARPEYSAAFVDKLIIVFMKKVTLSFLMCY